MEQTKRFLAARQQNRHPVARQHRNTYVLLNGADVLSHQILNPNNDKLWRKQLTVYDVRVLDCQGDAVRRGYCEVGHRDYLLHHDRNLREQKSAKKRLEWDALRERQTRNILFLPRRPPPNAVEVFSLAEKKKTWDLIIGFLFNVSHVLVDFFFVSFKDAQLRKLEKFTWNKAFVNKYP